MNTDQPASSDHPKHGEQRGREFKIHLPADHVLRGGTYTCSVRWFSEWWLFWKHPDGHWVTYRQATPHDLRVADDAPASPPTDQPGDVVDIARMRGLAFGLRRDGEVKAADIIDQAAAELTRLRARKSPPMTANEWAGLDSTQRADAMLSLAEACAAGAWDFAEQAGSEACDGGAKASIARCKKMSTALAGIAEHLRADAKEWNGFAATDAACKGVENGG
jgi:hypothetical protein